MERKSKVGMEVPFIGSDSIKWIEASVPDTYASASDSPSIAPPTKDCASCSMIGTPPTYLIWRICERMPHSIEILELNADKDIPRVGLRIFFPEALSPFAYICKNEINSAYSNVYLLYVLSISGIAYLIRLKNISTYTGSFIFSSNEILHADTSISPECSHITAVTATPGCIVVGRNDGSVSCFKLGVLDENAPGFTYELRDEAPLSRLWGLMSRSRLSGSVSDLVVSDINRRKVVFVLHSDGTLRVWDVLRHGKLFGQSLSSPGYTFLRMWVGPVDVDGRSIALAILYTQSMEVNAQGIGICNLNFSSGDGYNLSLGSSMQYIPLSQEKLIDVKLASNKIWVLKEDGLLAHDLISPNVETEKGPFYSLQETFIAEQLFQSSEHSLDDLYQTTCSIFSSKAQIIGFVSSIVLRRLLHPGVYNGSVMRMTLQDYDKRWTDNEFQALTIDELSKEILLLIEHEVINGSSFSAFKCWKEFCARYFDRWCKCNMPFSLYVDANNGAVGLIRENAVSLFRALEAVELFVYGNFGKLQDFAKFGYDVSGDGLEHEILFEVLRCSRLLSLRLGPSVSPIVYESIVGASTISSEDIVPRLLNTMKCGYKASVTASNVSDLGADFLWKKEIAENKNLRKFTMDTLISIHDLCEKASGWGGVLNAIERYLNLLVPRKPTENVDSIILDANVSIIVQATSQVAEIMFESALSILLFLNYILDISGQVQMSSDDRSKIQLELIPMIHETVTEWLIIHFLAIMPSESYSAEDFSSQLSSLKIDSDSGKKSLTAKLGSVDFTLAFVLVLDAQGSSQGHAYQSLRCLPNPGSLGKLVQDFSGWLVWGISGEVPAYSFAHSTEIALCLLRHRQYHAVESLLMIVDAHLRNEKLSSGIQNSDGQWCVLHHLRGCSLLAQVQGGLCGSSKEKKVREAMRCFFRASSGEGAVLALQKLPYEAGFSPMGITGNVSAAGWKLHYYQWVMQKFEQYNVSVVACQFALAALEQVDEAVAPDGNASKVFFADESTTSIKGRLWANVFKFALDLDEYYDAYCALVSNPDDESRFICLRRFVIVLYERGATKILCDSQLPFIGLIDKAEQELAWKAACSDISAKPNPYKLLYAFEMHQQNWRKAATYIYLYSVRLKNEMALRNYQNIALFFQERLNGISAAINCLHLVHPMHAWIDSQMAGNHLQSASHPNKKARVEEEQCKVNAQAQRQDLYIDIDTLEDEFVLTSAEYLLSLANVRWTRSENRKFPSDLVELLVVTNLYDMAFTVVLRFWKDSGLKRELEKVFSAMTLKCCPNKASTSIVGSPGLLLTYSNDEMMMEESFHAESHSKQTNSQWEVLEQYLEKYKAFHGRLPAIVAETLLRSDSQIELPLWLINMFKSAQKENRGMTGQELNPATLFGLYVDYGRYPEATELLIEYIEAYASLRPAGVIHRKKPFATWFPYTTIERLWCQLEDSISKGQMTNQCEKLKVLLHGALRSHLTLLKTDSEDATAFA